MENYKDVLEKAREVIHCKGGLPAKLKVITKILRTSVPYYDWVGFYLVDANNPDELVLGPFSGIPTEHGRIPVGKGICGQAAEKREMLVVQDVAAEKNYLSCHPDVKSEIVAPIFKGNKIVGEIDIDSHTAAPFTDEDRRLLKELCQNLSEIFE